MRRVSQHRHSGRKIHSNNRDTHTQRHRQRIRRHHSVRSSPTENNTIYSPSGIWYILKQSVLRVLLNNTSRMGSLCVRLHQKPRNSSRGYIRLTDDIRKTFATSLETDVSSEHSHWLHPTHASHVPCSILDYQNGDEPTRSCNVQALRTNRNT